MLPIQEAELPASPSPSLEDFHTLHLILNDLRAGNLSSAIAWAAREAIFLDTRSSQLEFSLHRSRFLRIALGRESSSSSRDDDMDSVMDGEEGNDHFMEAREHHDNLSDPDGDEMDEDGMSMHASTSKLIHNGNHLNADGDIPALSTIEKALVYGREHFRPTQSSHLDEIKRLYTFLLFLPDSRMEADLSIYSRESLMMRIPPPYHSFLDEELMHGPSLAPLFQREFTARQGVARDAPLKVAVEVGAGGALNIIIKVRSLMKEKGNEWSQADELPVSQIFFQSLGYADSVFLIRSRFLSLRIFDFIARLHVQYRKSKGQKRTRQRC